MGGSTVQNAIRLRDILRAQELRIVLVESCTAGRIAATLGALPGISDWLCGSFVVYRNDSKSRWLDIAVDLINAPGTGPVSAPVTEGLAQAGLRRTPEADLCLAITGEIGPGAIPEVDGIVFCAITSRPQNRQCIEFKLESPAPQHNEDLDARIRRLDEATERALQFSVEFIDG